MTPEDAFEEFGADILDDSGIECRGGANREKCMEFYNANMTGEFDDEHASDAV